MILYEYPFNERVRTLLRLEDLFERLDFFLGQANAKSHHVALTTLFEILDVAGRADLKSDLLQELERQRQSLMALRHNPAVALDRLEATINEIEVAATTLANIPGKTGQYLREHEWLTSIRSRSIIPGGTCEFDLPSYHAWLHRPSESRSRDLTTWIQPMYALRDCLAIILRLLRESGQEHEVVALIGNYQQMLGGKSYQMLQVRMDEQLGAIPEISANRYMLWVRFTTQDGGDVRPKPVDADIPFELILCNF